MRSFRRVFLTLAFLTTAFALSACDSDGPDDLDAGAPFAPAGVSATVRSDTVEVSWEAVEAGDLSDYLVFRGTEPAPTQQVAAVGTDTSYLDTAVEAGQTYYYRIRAVDEEGNESGFSDEVTATLSVRATVMSYNVYLGFNIFTLLDADGLGEALTLAGQSYRTLLQTDFPARAEVLADQIEEADPALVGLQEVSLYRTQDGSDFLANQEVNADSIFLDYLSLLQDALDARGLDYRAAAVVENADVELPVPVDTAENGNPILHDVRLTDRDVILARAGVQTSDAETGRYQDAATFSVGGSVGVELVRGYAKVRATVEGQPFTFVNSHVEGLMPEHEAQINELKSILAGYPAPVVLTGDLNTPADGSGPPGYSILVENGPYLDADAEARADAAEPTCCVGETLRGDSFSEKRIDFVLYRGMEVQAVSAEVLGDEFSDKTPSGLWPSDHAGVAATLEFGE